MARLVALPERSADLPPGCEIRCKFIVVRRGELSVGRDSVALQQFSLVISVLANIEGRKIMLGTGSVRMDVAEAGGADGKSALEERLGFEQRACLGEEDAQAIESDRKARMSWWKNRLT